MQEAYKSPLNAAQLDELEFYKQHGNRYDKPRAYVLYKIIHLGETITAMIEECGWSRTYLSQIKNAYIQNGYKFIEAAYGDSAHYAIKRQAWVVAAQLGDSPVDSEVMKLVEMVREL